MLFLHQRVPNPILVSDARAIVLWETFHAVITLKFKEALISRPVVFRASAVNMAGSKKRRYFTMHKGSMLLSGSLHHEHSTTIRFQALAANQEDDYC